MKMEEWSNTDNGDKVPRSYRVPVTTIVGWYDPDSSRRLSSYVFPAMYGAYGFVYEDDKEALANGCSLHVETTNRGTLVFELKTDIKSSSMNKFHVNVAMEDGANTATIYCQNEMLATRSLEGPKNPNLGYTVNGIPFDDETDNKVTTKPDSTVPDTTTLAIFDNYGQECWTAYGCSGDEGIVCDNCGQHDGQDMLCCRKGWNIHPNCNGAVFKDGVGSHQCVYIDTLSSSWTPETIPEPTHSPTLAIGDNYGQECWSAYGCSGDKGTVCDNCGQHDGQDMLCCRKGWNNHPNCDGAVFKDGVGSHQCVYIDTLSSSWTP